jgi:hypothetical protein
VILVVFFKVQVSVRVAGVEEAVRSLVTFRSDRIRLPDGTLPHGRILSAWLGVPRLSSCALVH